MQSKEFFLMGLMIGLSSGIYASIAAEKEAGKAAHKAVDELIQARDREELNYVVEKIRKSTFSVQNTVLFYCWSNLNQNHVILAEIDGGPDVDQDMSLVSGRCAWLVSAMLDIPLSPINEVTPDQIIQDALEVVRRKWIEKNELASRKEKLSALIKNEIDKLPVDRRLALAQTNSIEIGLLSALSLDEDSRVRLAVATNDLTDSCDLFELMEREQSGEIYDMAKKYYYRTPEYSNPHRCDPDVRIEDIIGTYKEDDLVESPFFKNYTNDWFTNPVASATNSSIAVGAYVTNDDNRSRIVSTNEVVPLQQVPPSSSETSRGYWFVVSGIVAGVVLSGLFWRSKK